MYTNTQHYNTLIANGLSEHNMQSIVKRQSNGVALYFVFDRQKWITETLTLNVCCSFSHQLSHFKVDVNITLCTRIFS